MSKVRIVRVSVLDRDGYSSDMTEGELATLMHRQPQALVVAEIQCAREWALSSIDYDLLTHAHIESSAT
mgnify:CR=1 FL=1